MNPITAMMKDRVNVQSKKKVDRTGNRLVSVVIPAYNEAEVLPEFHERISKVLNSMAMDAEILYVNDGSTDDTLKIMHGLRQSDQRVSILDLSRNFGKEAAMTAGLDHASGDAVVLIDADLQHPPELIPELVKHWIDGYDVVYTTNVDRSGETIVKKFITHSFYRLMKMFGRVDIPMNAGDYRLLSRRAVDSLTQLREQHRYMKGLFAWIGYPQKDVPYQPDPRFAGNTKWGYLDLWYLALEAITSFTVTPLKIATYLGLASAFIAFIYGAITVYQKLVYGNPVAGYPSLLVAVLFLGGIQLLTIGIIGEYLGRIFNETKQRPLYFLKGYEPSSSRKTQS
ncbi:MAG: glycosyltransferase family 2 protein [Thermodesulfobacteriota bacterium]